MAVGRRQRGLGRGISMGEFAIKASTYANAGQAQADLAGVKRAALFVTNAARASIKAGSGGDSRLSNVGRNAARVGARYDIQGTQNPTALVRATGPLHLLDNPTAAHLITAKGYRLSRAKKNRESVYNALFGGTISGPIGSAKRAKPMRTPFGPRYYAQHPGTRGKRTFMRAVDAAKPYATREFADGQRQNLRRYFG